MVPVRPKTGVVTRCDCQIRARTQSLTGGARIPRRYEHCELANYDFEGPRRSLASARMAPADCRGVPTGDTGLLLIGSIGVGKTHLAVGIVKELVLGKGIGCLFYDYVNCSSRSRTRYNRFGEGHELVS